MLTWLWYCKLKSYKSFSYELDRSRDGCSKTASIYSLLIEAFKCNCITTYSLVCLFQSPDPNHRAHEHHGSMVNQSWWLVYLLAGLFPLCQFPLCQFPLRQFPFGQLPTLSIPILPIPIWSMLTKRELTKWELTKWEVDKVGRFTIWDNFNHCYRSFVRQWTAW